MAVPAAGRAGSGNPLKPLKPSRPVEAVEAAEAAEAAEAVWGDFPGEIGLFWAVSGPMLHRRRNVVQRVDIVAVNRCIENFLPSPTFFLTDSGPFGPILQR